MTTPTQPTASAIPLGLLICSTMGLFFLLVARAAGGQAFYESLYGDYTLWTLVAGLAAGLVGKSLPASSGAKQRMHSTEHSNA